MSPRRGKKRTSKSKTTQSQVKSLIRMVQELKYFAYSQVGVSVSSGMFITGGPFDVAQGTGDQQRDGDRLQWCGKIDLKMSFTVQDNYNVFRFVIFQWHPSSSPIGTDVFINGPSGVVDYWSQYNHDNRQQYKILFDKTYVLVGNGTAGTYPGTTSSHIVKHYSISLKKAQKYAQRIGGGLTGTNRMYMAMVSDSSVVPHPVLNCTTKIFFRDS